MTHPLVAKILERAANPTLATDHAREFPGVGQALVDDHLLSAAEAALGRALPSLLADLYRFVGNGGFGPGYGILPLIDPASTDTESVVSLHSAFCSCDPDDPEWSWPSDLVPFCDWGCAIRSCVDCSSPGCPILTFDPNVHEVGQPLSNAISLTHPTLEAWFGDWLAGVNIWELMFEPDTARATIGTNPFTREPFSIVPTKLRRS